MVAPVLYVPQARIKPLPGQPTVLYVQQIRHHPEVQLRVAAVHAMQDLLARMAEHVLLAPQAPTRTGRLAQPALRASTVHLGRQKSRTVLWGPRRMQAAQTAQVAAAMRATRAQTGLLAKSVPPERTRAPLETRHALSALRARRQNREAPH